MREAELVQGARISTSISRVETAAPRPIFTCTLSGSTATWREMALWPILHYRLDIAEFSRRDLSGYMRVNQHFATELNKVLQSDDIVWVHDYHLLPLAKSLRNGGHPFHALPFTTPSVFSKSMAAGFALGFTRTVPA